MPPEEVLEHSQTPQDDGMSAYDDHDEMDEEDYYADITGGNRIDPNSAEAEHLIPLYWKDVKEQSYDSFLECM